MSNKFYVDFTREQLELVISGLRIYMETCEKEELCDTDELLDQCKLICELEFLLRVR